MCGHKAHEIAFMLPGYVNGLQQIAVHPERDPCSNCLCRCKQFSSNCSKPVVCFKNQSKNYRVKSSSALLYCLKFSSSKGIFLLMQWLTACLSDYFVMLLWFCTWANVSSVRLLGVKGKNKQIEPGEASRDVFKDRVKQFCASLLSIASSCSDELYHDDLVFEVGLLFPQLHFLLLVGFCSSFQDLHMKRSHDPFAHSQDLVFLLEAQMGMLSYTDS